MSKEQNMPGIERRRFRPYPQYKDSGVEWLATVPTSWRICAVKHRFDIFLGKMLQPEPASAHDLQVPYLKAANVQWENIGLNSLQTMWASKDEIQTGQVAMGDLLVCEGGEVGRAAILTQKPEEPTIIQNALHRVRSQSELPKFLMYLLEVSASGGWLDVECNKATIQHFTRDKFGSLRIALPSLDEQCRIVSFLDRETAKIDALIEKKERLIELLQEKHTALITQAVTKGLDPTVPMKDSGVEWLGEIPAHWECLALSRVSFARCDGPFGSGLRSEHYSESGVRVVRLQNIGSVKFSDTDRAYINEEYARRLGDHSVLPEDLLIAGLGDDAHPVGRACVAPEHIAPAMVKADCFRFRLDVRLLLARFAAYQLSATAAAAAGSLSTGATRSRLNLTAMTARKVAMPPLREQAAIVSVLDQGCDENYALIGTIQAAINHLREYRAALISAAVTGKMDVREAQ